MKRISLFCSILFFTLLFFIVFPLKINHSFACEGVCLQSTCGNGNICWSDIVGSTIGDCIPITNHRNKCSTTPGTPGSGNQINTGQNGGTVPEGGQCSDPNGHECQDGLICYKWGSYAQTGLYCVTPDVANMLDENGERAVDPAAPPCENMDKDTGCKSLFTGLGMSIGTDSQSFIKNFFGIILSISGGIALLLIILSGYRMTTSGGNPEKVQGAREQLTSAIVGLIFIIFSFAILQLIGVDILHIPGFS